MLPLNCKRSCAMGSEPLATEAAQPGIAADRFAREIVLFDVILCSALAAAECQIVSWQLIKSDCDWKLCISDILFLPRVSMRMTLAFVKGCTCMSRKKSTP